MADKKKKLAKNKRGTARRKFSTPAQTRAQLEGITAAQERYRRVRKQIASGENEATEAPIEGIIIESREKSEQAWQHAL